MTKYKRWFTSVNRAIVAEMAMQKKTQKDLAEVLQIHPVTINRKLKDPGTFFLSELGQICETLNIDLKNPPNYGTSAN
jgi:DNA-binding Xre family transcriptional regulator